MDYTSTRQGRGNVTSISSAPSIQAQHRTARPQQRRSSAAQQRRRSAVSDERPARRRIRSELRTKGGFDVPFLAIVLILVTVGLIMMLSASYTYCYYYFNGDSFYYFKRQLIFAVFGIFAMMVVSTFNYEKFKKISTLILIVSYILLVVVLIIPPPEGFEEFHRWISLPGLGTFQPSEIAKFAIILFFAYHMDKYYIGINSREIYDGRAAGMLSGRSGNISFRTRTICTVLYLLIIGSVCVLVYKENHVSGTLLIFALGMMMMYLAGFPRKWFVIGVAAFIVVAVYVVTHPQVLPAHAQVRITSWLDKDMDPLNVRWQTNHALYAIGSGGFFGVGLGNSKMKQMYVSQPQNDFIFSIVCEELGFVGALLIVVLFCLLVWRGFVIGIHAKDKFGALLAMGLVFQVGLQAAINIAVVTDLFPNTGISLPFFSYGGTSLLMLLGEMGIVLNISRTAKLKKI